jgi:hypothetical protein
MIKILPTTKRIKERLRLEMDKIIKKGLINDESPMFRNTKFGNKNG